MHLAAGTGAIVPDCRPWCEFVWAGQILTACGVLCMYSNTDITLTSYQCKGVSYYLQFSCLFNALIILTTKIWKLHITGHFWREYINDCWKLIAKCQKHCHSIIITEISFWKFKFCTILKLFGCIVTTRIYHKRVKQVFFVCFIIPPLQRSILLSPCPSVRPSVRLSVCGQNRVRSVFSTILVGSVLYFHI